MPQNLVLSANTALSLFDDITKLKELGDAMAKVRSVASAEDLLNKLADNVNSQATADAFNAAGLGDAYAAIKTSLSKIVDAAGKIPNKYKALLKPLSAFVAGSTDGDVFWDISTGGAPPVATTLYSLNLGASAKLEFNAGASWPGANLPGKLLSIGASGNVKLGASATFPATLLSLGLSGNASADLALDYYFSPDPNTIYALAVAESAMQLADPFDLGTVFTRINNKDLNGIVYKFNRAANAQVKVSLADLIVASNGISVDLGANITVSTNVSNAYQLSLQRASTDSGAFALRAQMSRNPVSSTGLDASFGVDVDLTALTKRVTDALDTAIGKWDSTLDMIRPFLKPGTWLRTNGLAFLSKELDGIVSNPGLKAALINDINEGFGAQDKTDGGLADWLSDQLTSAIDRGSVLVTGDLTKEIGNAVDALNKVSPTLGAAGPQQVKNLVTSAVQKVDDDLKTAVNQLIAKPKAEIETALKNAGQTVTGVVNQFDDALTNVRNLLESVNKKLHDILAKAEDGLKQKASAQIHLNELSTTGTVIEVDGLISTVDAGAQAIFEAMARGRLQDLVGLFDKPATPSFTLLPTSSITKFAKFQSERGVEVAFLGIDLKAAEVVNADATIVKDSLGNVHVDSTGDVTKTFTTPFDEREVSFADSYALALAGQMKAAASANPAAVPPVLEMGAGGSYQTSKLSSGDVADFIRALTNRNLISAAAEPAAETAFDSWAQADNSAKISGSIAASLRLRDAQVVTLLDGPGYFDPSGNLTEGRQEKIVNVALAILRRAPSGFNAAQFARGRDLAGQYRLHDATISGEADLVLNYHEKLMPLRRPSDINGPPTDQNIPGSFLTHDQQPDFYYFFEQAYALRQLVAIIEKMGQIYRSKARPGVNGAWDEKRYRDTQREIMDSSRKWLVLTTSILGLFDPQLRPRTVAFIRILADLAGITGNGGVTLTLTHNSPSGDAQTAAFA